MRDGLDAPTLEVPAENRESIRAFLDGQSRIKLAVWVPHEQRGVDGPLYDHHLVLGLADEDCRTGDMRALDSGMRCPWPHLTEPTWIDIYPVSEVEAFAHSARFSGSRRCRGTIRWTSASHLSQSRSLQMPWQPSGDWCEAWRPT